MLSENFYAYFEAIIFSLKYACSRTNLHKNIDEQASAHIHAGEVILTYSRSKTVESFLKAAAKKRQFQVIICEGAPLAVQATKRSSMRYVTEGERAAIAAMGGDQTLLAETEDAEEGVNAFKERRKGNFKGK